jgi:hypothetical protein
MCNVTLVEAPTSAGAYAPGQEDGPGALVDAGLVALGVAHMLDLDGTVDGLAALAGQRPMLSAGQVSLLGLGPHTDFEAKVIADRVLPVVDVLSKRRVASSIAVHPIY